MAFWRILHVIKDGILAKFMRCKNGILQIIPEQNKPVFRIGCIIWQTHQAKLMADSYQQ